MEAGSAIALAIVLLAGGGSAGAIMMTDAGNWTHHAMMGYGGHMMDGDAGDCPYHDGSAEDCPGDEGYDHEECEEHSAEDCPYHDEGGYRSGGCCD